MVVLNCEDAVAAALHFNGRRRTCSTISNSPYNLIFTTKFNDSSILITIISCDYLNLSLADEHV
jgi:hypothetical protein